MATIAARTLAARRIPSSLIRGRGPQANGGWGPSVERGAANRPVLRHPRRPRRPHCRHRRPCRPHCRHRRLRFLRCPQWPRRLPRRRPRRHRRNRPQPLTSAAPRAPVGRVVAATRRMHSPRMKAGRRPLAPAPQPVSMGRGPIFTPRRPLQGRRATCSLSPMTAPRAPTVAWASTPWPFTTICTGSPWAISV